MRWLLVVVVASAAGCEKDVPSTGSTAGSAQFNDRRTDPETATAQRPTTVVPAAPAAPPAPPAPEVAQAPSDVTPPPVRVSAAERARIRAAEKEAQKFADALTSESANPTTTTADMNRRRAGADLGQQISNVRDSGKTIAVGGGGRGTGGPRVGTGTSGGSASPDPATKLGRISVSSRRALDDTSLTVDSVLAKMQVYMPSLRRCYQTELARDPSARGKLVLALQVNESGRSAGATAVGVSDTLAACAHGVMTGWRFPVPKDKDGEATEAGFQIALQLTPD